ncbi:MAG: hypothetical protein ACYTFG_22430 [Planctomycetota bacterium]|jgi:hypothetical protein
MERTCAVKLVEFGSLKALVSVQVGDMEVRGFKVIDQGDNKPWVAPRRRRTASATGCSRPTGRK